jgi:hypothetical protein
MRENRTYSSEGGEGLVPFPTPIAWYGVDQPRPGLHRELPARKAALRLRLRKARGPCQLIGNDWRRGNPCL